MISKPKQFVRRAVSLTLCLAVFFPIVAFSGYGKPEKNQSLTVFCYNQDTLKLATSVIGRFAYSHPGIKVEFVEIPRFDTYVSQEGGEDEKSA